MATFDPYHKWLGIPPKDQPPTLYRLLGLDQSESDPEIIDAAANRQMSYLKQVAAGSHAAESQKLLAEISAARLRLLDPKKKAAYDRSLAAASEPEPELEPVVDEAAPVFLHSGSSGLRRRKSVNPAVWVSLLSVIGMIAAGGIWYATRPGDFGQKPPTVEKHARHRETPEEPVADERPAPRVRNPDRKVARVRPRDDSQPKPKISKTKTGAPPPETQPDPKTRNDGEGGTTAGIDVFNQKEPVPDGAALEAAAKTVQEVYGADIEKAKSPSARTAVARQLLAQADDRKNDLATVYSLQLAARDLAAEAGDLPLALQAVDQLTAMFDTAPRRLKEEALESAAKSAKVSTQRKAVAETALELAEAAADEDDFSSAERLSKIAVSAGRGASDSALSKRVAARVKELDEQRKAYEVLQADLATLESNPDDPEANLRVGRYECFTKQDWDRGLARLAKGSDAGLQELAQRELENPKDPKERLAVADGWDQLAGADKSTARASLEDHAEEWYRLALTDLTGIDKLRVEKKLAAADAQKSKRDSRSGPALRSLRPGVVGEYFGDVSFEKRVLMRLDPMINFDWGGGAPDVSMPPDNFGIRWHGYLKAPRAGKYTLILVCDNGCRMTLDGKTIIDRLGTGGQHRLTADVELTDKPTPFQIDYNEGIFTAWCRLRWSSAGRQGFPEQPVGPEFLFHTREQEKLNTQGK